MKRGLFRSSDALLAAFLIAITAMLLVPLPTLVLDFLLVLNISFSLLLLLAGLYMPNALALLSFPSILLLTTLFRLGLNVASTRLILSQGDAGTVIQSFGTFLIRGEIVVGLIIFLILTVVNFIVVARGAARVSEVAARFALDALPGKQMAIDSDLRAGLINATEAQRRREELRKESQLYGSMDGAMKFVQGDAVAGLFIIATNILGGIYLGIRSGMSFSEAINTYTILTVGDGLVHQMPAILVSICAGIVVTRVSSGEGSSLGSDVQAQVFMRPGTLLFSGTLLVLIGVMPGLPALPFVSVGLLLACFGAWQYRRGSQDAEALERSGLALGLPPGLAAGALPPGSRAEFDDTSDSEAAPLIISLDANGLYRQYSEDRPRFLRWWQTFEADFFSETGLTLPRARIVSDSLAPYGHFAVKVRGSSVIEEVIPPDSLLIEINPLNADVLGFDLQLEAEHPLDGSRVLWIPETDSNRRIAEAAGISCHRALEYIAFRVADFFVKAPEEVLSVAEVLEIESALEEKYPGLISRTLNREFMGPPRVAEILQELVRHGIGIRDTKQIIEAIASYCASLDPQRISDGDFILDDAVQFIRVARRRHTLSRHLTARRSLKVITVSQEVDEIFEGIPAGTPQAPLALSNETSAPLRKALDSIVTPLRNRGVGTAVVLCRSEVRSAIAKFLRHYAFRLPVITFEELEPSIALEQVARWQESGGVAP